MLVIFLPPLLYAAAFFATCATCAPTCGSISLLAIGLVLVTTAAVAVVAHEVDPRAAVGGRVHARRDRRADGPGRGDRRSPAASASRGGSSTILEGESLLNDGTALVAYQAAVVAVGGTFSLLDAGWRVRAGRRRAASPIGLAAGWVIAAVRRRIDDPLVETTISLLCGYAGYVPGRAARLLGRARRRVTVGIYVGWRAPEIASAAPAAARASRCGRSCTFLLNALLFVLIGLQLPTILDGPRGPLAGDADRPGGGDLRRGHRLPDDLARTRRCSSSARSTGGLAARPPGRLARADDLRLVRACAAPSRSPPRSRSRRASPSAT